MTVLALIRHGHTAWNRAGRIQGRSDIPLDNEAETGLANLALPAPWNRSELWASPLKRARRTAELISGRTPRTTPALTEMNWGKWEGLQGTALRTDPASGFRDIENWGWSYRPPGGETPAELLARLTPWVDGLTCDAVAVCHIGVMRVLMARATGWNFDGPAPFRIKRNRLFIMDISQYGWELRPDPVRLTGRAL